MGWAELAAAPPQLGRKGEGPLQARGQEATEELCQQRVKTVMQSYRHDTRLLWSPLRYPSPARPQAHGLEHTLPWQGQECTC